MKISSAVINQLQIQYETTDLKSFGPSEFRVISPAYVIVNIKIDNATVSNIKCRLVSDENLPVEILVGRPFTDHETVKYVKEGDTLTFFQVDVPLTAPGLHLRARTDVTMLPNSINFIEIASSDGSCRVPATGNYPVSTRIKEGASIGRGEIAELPVLTIVPEKRPIKMEEIVIGERRITESREELLGIINEFRDCVAVDMSEIGCARGVEIEISEKPGATPVYCKPYKARVRQNEKRCAKF
ncbi:unnamed protein product [Trichogramma brassicae]|uniref:Uncharacterized protein n=1 Tax=Trichogramma brassicae TaxID=86971 RepID=A0A6H5IKI7_9HYME|nr:unnamed protein product [Trichogramma brassicae]